MYLYNDVLHLYNIDYFDYFDIFCTVTITNLKAHVDLQRLLEQSGHRSILKELEKDPPSSPLSLHVTNHLPILDAVITERQAHMQ